MIEGGGARIAGNCQVIIDVGRVIAGRRRPKVVGNPGDEHCRRLDAMGVGPGQLLPVVEATAAFPALCGVHATAGTVHARKGAAQILFGRARQRYAQRSGQVGR
jgi:hypothetical protein